MTWYQYTLLSLACICYSIKDLQIFGKLKWSSKWGRLGFWDRDSWVRKWSNVEMQIPKFKGSSTYLVFLTDGVHLMQFVMKICLSIGIFNFTIQAIYFWLGWTFLQYLTFKIASR